MVASVLNSIEIEFKFSRIKISDSEGSEISLTLAVNELQVLLPSTCFALTLIYILSIILVAATFESIGSDRDNVSALFYN